MNSLEYQQMMHNKQKREEGEAKRRKMFESYFKQDQTPPLLNDRVRPRGVDEDLGTGYSSVELRKTFNTHCRDVEDMILKKAGTFLATAPAIVLSLRSS